MSGQIEDSQNEDMWHHHPIFQRFWSHYTQSYYWYKHHLKCQQLSQSLDCQNKLLEERHYDKDHQQCPNIEETVPLFDEYRGREYEAVDNEKCQMTDDGEVSFEMEVTEDLINFLEETEKHRKSLQSLKRKAQKDYNKYSEDSSTNSVSPPKCRQLTTKRAAEMKTLYGSAAAKVHGMETAMQLTFDRYCDLKEPKLWPNIPLCL